MLSSLTSMLSKMMSSFVVAFILLVGCIHNSTSRKAKDDLPPGDTRQGQTAPNSDAKQNANRVPWQWDGDFSALNAKTANDFYALSGAYRCVRYEWQAGDGIGSGSGGRWVSQPSLCLVIPSTDKSGAAGVKIAPLNFYKSDIFWFSYYGAEFYLDANSGWNVSKESQKGVLRIESMVHFELMPWEKWASTDGATALSADEMESSKRVHEIGKAMGRLAVEPAMAGVYYNALLSTGGWEADGASSKPWPVQFSNNLRDFLTELADHAGEFRAFVEAKHLKAIEWSVHAAPKSTVEWVPVASFNRLELNESTAGMQGCTLRLTNFPSPSGAEFAAKFLANASLDGLGLEYVSEAARAACK